jgi:hypothetical protein
MNIFELLIYAIITIALIFMVITLFDLPKEDTIIKELQETINIAQTDNFLGKTIILETKLIQKDFYLNKIALEDALSSTAIECNNPKICCIRQSEQDKNQTCTKPLIWDYDFFRAEQETTVKTSVRCLNEFGVPICRIYFGSYPAQSQIVEITKLSENNSGKIISTIKVKNSGETQLSFGMLKLTLQKEVLGNWEDTEIEYNPQEIHSLLPQQEHSFIQEVNINTIGNYKLVYTFSGINSGFDKNALEIKVSKNSCEIIEEENYEIQTIEEGKKYNEIKKCQNCDYAYECANAWQNKYLNINYQILTKEKTYCEKTSENGACE